VSFFTVFWTNTLACLGTSLHATVISVVIQALGYRIFVIMYKTVCVDAKTVTNVTKLFWL
jgi:hypothetical protein